MFSENSSFGWQMAGCVLTWPFHCTDVGRDREISGFFFLINFSHIGG